MWDQAPADRRDEDDADQRHAEPDRREVEHAERLADDLRAVGRDDHIRWCADHGHQPAQKRRERQGHQDLRRGTASLVTVAQCHREHQGKRTNIIHEGGKNRAKRAGGKDLQCDIATCRSQEPD